MATFKGVVQRHQKRRDGKYPVSIRITQNRKSVYLPTGLYIDMSQINKKSFEIKDQFVLTRVCMTIDEYEKSLLTIDTETLRLMSADELKMYLGKNANDIDYLKYCNDLIAKYPEKYSYLRSAVNIIYEMGIKQMKATEFTSQFINRYKRFMDERVTIITRKGVKVGEKKLKNRAKNLYLIEICKVFRMMQREYNSEFKKIIPQDPFVNFEYYKEEVKPKRSISVDKVREFFAIEAKTEKTQIAKDMLMMSFCMCGINLIDLMLFEKSEWNRDENCISYNRTKTEHVRTDGALSSIRIEPEIQGLFNKYLSHNSSKYLFDFGGMQPSKASTRNVGMSVDRLCKSANFQHISQYWLRHTWATIARNECNISKDDIDLCLDHVGNNKMADVYIKTDWSRKYNANRKVLDYVFGEKESGF